MRACIFYVEREGRREKMRKKNLMWISSIILLILSLLGGLTVNTIKVSSDETPAIYIDPAETWNTSLTPGMNYAISIRTNYTGDDIWSYQFELEYNPNVLHGGINNTDTWTADGGTHFFGFTRVPIVEDSEIVYVNGTLQTRGEDYFVGMTGESIFFPVAPGAGAEVIATYIYDGVVNGDLITTAKNDTAKFEAGDFNNTLGRLGQTRAYFDYSETGFPPPMTYGPGILANITFHVVGYGFSDITLRYMGQAKTRMQRYNATAQPEPFEDIPTILQHGFFSNIPSRNDVAVTSLVVPATAVIEQPVPISVNVKNNGTYDENVNLTVYHDTTVIDSKTFLLKKGLNNTVSFSWDTSGLAPSPPSYTINATATVLVSAENPTGVDDEPGDNSATQSVTLSMVHDVAVTSLVVPATAAIEQPVPISVTVANEGSYTEDVTLTVYYENATETTVIDFSCSWDTSGKDDGIYTINATATVLVSAENPTGVDDEPGDNSATQSVTLSLVHDVAVTSLVVQTLGTIEHPVPISVTVSNEGSYDESVVSLTVYYDSTVINSTSFPLAKGPTSNTSSFSWNTSGIAPAMYTINATATITVDNDLSDNNKTRTISLVQIHNVAVVNIEVPRRGNVSDTVPINVTVKNVGSYTETFNVTTYYDDTAIVLPNGKNYTTVTDLACTENTTILFTWNTTGVAPGFYTITAAAGLSNTDTWTGDGANTTFRTSRKPVLEDSEKVYVDGTLMTKSDNYTISYVAGKIEFKTAPSGGAQIKVTYTSALVNETYISDNTETAPWDVLVTILGDVDGDGAVGTSDLIAFSDAYGSEPGDPNWDPYCDFNSDEKIDASGLFDLSKNYGKTV